MQEDEWIFFLLITINSPFFETHISFMNPFPNHSISLTNKLFMCLSIIVVNIFLTSGIIFYNSGIVLHLLFEIINENT